MPAIMALSVRTIGSVVTNPIIPWTIVTILIFYIVSMGPCLPPEPTYIQRNIPVTVTNNHRKNKTEFLTRNSLKQAKTEFVTRNSFKRAIPMGVKLNHIANITRTFQGFESHVSILVYGVSRSHRCLQEQLKNIRSVFPKVRIVVGVKNITKNIRYKNIKFLSGSSIEGDTLNKMIAMVKTKYFLYLSRGDMIDKYSSDNSVGWLYRALEKVPKLDVIGASFLAYNSSLNYPHFQLDIQCHRTKMCHWVFSQTYEYQYSVGDVMICEETSSSFMARTRSLSAMTFDPTLDTMVTNDFFWRNKAKLIIGLMPEVYLHVRKTCQITTPSASQDSLNKQGFMDKYSLSRLVDSFGRVTNYPQNPQKKKTHSVLPAMNFVRHGGVNIPQARETLRYYMGFVDDMFNKHKISYILGAGVTLGGVKMRDVLPWDKGDVDTENLGDNCTEMIAMVNKEMVEKGARFRIATKSRPSGRCYSMTLLPRSYGVRNDVYERSPYPADQKMYLFIHDRYYPVKRNLFERFRIYRYGEFLQNLNDHAKTPHHCTIRGHHACVPDEFAKGAGNWKDLYC